jgi:hypothetical protein
VAGKPELPLHAEAVRRTGARNPLVVGDRLDTDIEGANRAGADSLLVLTGVCTPGELLFAPFLLRPTYLSETLQAGLNSPHPQVTTHANGSTCGGWQAVVRSGALELSGAGERMDALRAMCAAAWHSADAAQDDSHHASSGAVKEAAAALSQLGW